MHFRLFIIFYVNLHNFFGGRENSGTLFLFVEKSKFYIFGRVYEILPPHSLIGTISKLFPKISRWRLPWGKGTKNLLCFSVFIKQHIFSGHLFCKSTNILNALILYPALLWWTSFYLLLTEIQPSCFPFAAHRAYLWKKETYQLSNNVKLTKKTNLTDL